MITKTQLQFWTREEKFLVRWSVFLLAVAGLVGFVLSTVRPARNPTEVLKMYGVNPLPPLAENATAREVLDWARSWNCDKESAKIPNFPLPEGTTDVLQDFSEGQSPSEDQVEVLVSAVSTAVMTLEKMRERQEALLSKATDALPAGNSRAIQLYWMGRDGEAEQLNAALVTLRAMHDADASLRASIEGEFLSRLRDFSQALAAHQTAGQSPEAAMDRQRAVEIALGHHLDEAFHNQWARPETRRESVQWPEQLRQEALVKAHDYAGLLGTKMEQSVRWMGQHPWLSAVSLLAAFFWFVIIHQVAGLNASTNWRGMLGFLLGLLSPGMTLFILVLQEKYVGFHQDGTALNDLLFYVSGVGLREEISKILLFIPLLPLLWSRSAGEVMVAACCVGLGFAASENILYFSRDSMLSPNAGATGALPRFVTANFIHLALTGLCGLAIFQMMRWPRRYLDVGIVTLVGAVLLHGAYDFFLSSEQYFPKYGLDFLPYVLLALLAVRFFKLLMDHSEQRRTVIAPQAVMITGCILLLSVAFWILCWGIGFKPAFDMVGGGALGIGTVLAIYLWQLRVHN